MSIENVVPELTSRDETLVLGLKSALSSYKQNKSEVSSRKLIIALEGVCSSFCFGDEDFIRRVNVERYGALLVSTLITVTPQNHLKLILLTVQALALFADLVPRGGFAIAAAKGVQPILSLLKEIKIIGNDAILEELLKCISHVALEAHYQMIRHHAVNIITNLESRVGTYHLRMLCLKCLTHLLDVVLPEHWNNYLIKPCGILVNRFHHQVDELLLKSTGNQTEKLSKESEAYLLRLLECITHIYDRLLRSTEIIIKNNNIVEKSLPALVKILEWTASMGSQGVILRDAACSPLLKFFFTDPSLAIKSFLKYHVFHSICSILNSVLEGRTKRLSDNGAALAEALLGNDINAIPYIAEEQQAIPLLEFLLVIIPSTLLAHESDYYITIPHYTWQWEDDFHNRSDCNENLSKQLEGEYEKQRKLSEFIPYEVCFSSRILKIDFKYMNYTSNENSSYPHSLYRHCFLAGYIHRRVMRCNCKEKEIFTLMPEKDLPLKKNNNTIEGDRRISNNNNNNNNNNTGGIRSCFKSSYQNHNRHSTVPNTVENYTNHDYLFDVNLRRTRNTFQEQEISNGIIPSETDNVRLVDENNYCCCGIKPLFNNNNNNNNNNSNNRKKREEAFSRGNGEKGGNIFNEFLRDSREEILRSRSTRSLYLQVPMIRILVSWCLPVLITVIKKSVSPVIARHCSILILRCVDLLAEYLRDDHKLHRRDSLKSLRDKFFALYPQLGNVLSYLVNTTVLPGSIMNFVYPFREFMCDQHFIHLLTSLGLKINSRIPSMSLACETQMSALSTFLILHYSFSFEIEILNENQKFIIMRRIENLIGPIDKSKSPLRSAIFGSTGIILCSFHITPEVIQEVHYKLIEQVGIFIIGSITRVNNIKSNSSSMLSITRRVINTNPLDSIATSINSLSTNSSIIAEINARAEIHKELPLGVRQVLAIYEYMNECKNDLSSLVCENSEFLDQLALSLHDPIVKNYIFKTEIKEAFINVREGLARVINENTGVVNVEETSTIEKQASRFTRRLKRSKATLAILDRMWTPLRVKVEHQNISENTTLPLSPSPLRTILIGGKNHTILNINIEQVIFSILPTTPLNFIAKYIISQLNYHYIEKEKEKNDLSLSRNNNNNNNNNIQEGLEIGSFYSIPGLIMSDNETSREIFDEANRSIFSTQNMDSLSLSESSETVDSLLAVTSVPLREEEFGAEGILSSESAIIPTNYQKKQSNSHRPYSGGKKMSTSRSDLLNTISIDNIVFLCNGKPITDLSASVLELCFNLYPQLEEEYTNSIKRKNNNNNNNNNNQNISPIMQLVLSLWSTIHTIQYIIVKEPIIHKIGNINFKNKVECNSTLSSPKQIFSRLLGYPASQCCFIASAKVLSELGKVLNNAKVSIYHDEGRLCSALIHNFYNHLSALMLPPLAYPIICSSLNNQKDQHFASFILWTYPQIFSFDIRRTLFQLLLSVRRVPTPALSKLKEGSRKTGCVVPVYGLEWISPDVNIRGTKKVTVQRNNILESGAKVLRSHAMCPLPLSVEFENENGVGVGPAMEFYNLFSNQLQNIDLKMWKTEEFNNLSGNSLRRVQIPLFPSAYQTIESLSYFELLGFLVGRVLMEERVVDLPLHSTFTRAILGNIEDNKLSDIDPNLDHHLNWLISLNSKELEDCELTFVLPHSDFDISGGEIELCPHGAKKQINSSNLLEYIEAVQTYYCKTIFMKPIMHFMQGLRYTVIPTHLELFNAEELQLLISGVDGKIWESPGELEHTIHTAHGYTSTSKVVIYLLEVVSEWGAGLQRAFLKFVTGSTRLPLGGLQPPITIVRREGEARGGSISSTAAEGALSGVERERELTDAALPTVNTCVHYLKLPSYSSKELLREKLYTAVTEGQECFLLT